MSKPDKHEIYYHCHGVATCVELYAVKLNGAAGVAAYNRFMRGQVKRAEGERLHRIPREFRRVEASEHRQGLVVAC